MFKQLLASTLAASSIYSPMTAQASSYPVESVVDAKIRTLNYHLNGVEAKYGVLLPQVIFAQARTSSYGGCVSNDNRNAVSTRATTAYCGKTNTITLVTEQLKSINSRFGDGAVAYTVAHEYAHWMQLIAVKLSNNNGNTPNVPKGIVSQELQADCIAGWFMRHTSADMGYDKADWKEAVHFALAAGDSDHGSGKQRAASLLTGLKSDEINVCFADQLPGQIRSTINRIEKWLRLEG